MAGVWTLRPQATCVGSIPSSSCYVPSRSHCWAGPPADGKGEGGGTWHRPSLAGLPPHVLFAEFGMSWDAELSSLGRHWCHLLDLIAGQVSPSFQLGLGRLPAPLLPVPASLCLSLRWQLRAMQLGGRGSPSLSAVGPGHASEPILCKPFLSCLYSQTPLPVTPDARALRSIWNNILRIKGLETGQSIPIALISLPFSGMCYAQNGFS